MSKYVLAIDQGTTSTRAIIFDAEQRIVDISQSEFPQHFPASGWVEHDVEDIWHSVLATCRDVLKRSAISPTEIAGLGITNQRETTVLWDRKTGSPIHRAIVWQDRRTAPYCEKLRAAGHGEFIAERTGLMLDPYFSATKIAWLLDHVDGARDAAIRGEILFGTIDSYLLWKMTGGRVHKTDATNASRTMLYDIDKGVWSPELCEIFQIPLSILPEVCDCNHAFGYTIEDLLGSSIPIAGIAGDQHAAMIGQACFEPGMIKSTYGTGCFAVLNTGTDRIKSTHRMLTTLGYQLDGTPTYALEGSIFVAGAAIQWLRDGLEIIASADQSGALALEADASQKVIMVPAFSGLGAPYWEPNVRGSVFGLTRNTGPREMARAALEAVCYQTNDLIEAMISDFPLSLQDSGLRVDGGMVASEWAMQFLSDTLGCPVERPRIAETTAFGAAWLAGYTLGEWPGKEEFSANWQRDHRFLPSMDEATRRANLSVWRASVAATIHQQRLCSGEPNWSTEAHPGATEVT